MAAIQQFQHQQPFACLYRFAQNYLSNHLIPIMIGSDSEEIEQTEEFILHRASVPGKPTLSPIHQVLEECSYIMNTILNDMLQRSVREIITICSDCYTSEKGMVIPVKFRMNQQENLDQFIQLIKKWFNQADHQNEKINPFLLKSKVCILADNQVRDLVLKMYMHLDDQEENNGSPVIFVANQITDLSLTNIYCLEKGLHGRSYVAIFPTFENFENDEDYCIEEETYQKYQVILYNHKQVFCDFVYKCVSSQIVKAYLPPQVLSLFSDFDHYSISFKEGARRFMYCLERFSQLALAERQYVSFTELANIILYRLTERFKTYYNFINNLHENILKCILDQKEQFHIVQRFLNHELSLNCQRQQNFEEKTLVEMIRKDILKKLIQDQKLKEYAKFLTEEDQKPLQPKNRHKKSRSDLFGICSSKNLTPKNILQGQLSRMLKKATVMIRKQASQVQWEDIKFNLRIRPQIPRLIMEALQNSSEQRDLVEQIRSWYSVPLVRLVAKFGTGRMGELIYLIRNLEISGLIETTQKGLNLSVCTNFFDKANFSQNRKR